VKSRAEQILDIYRTARFEDQLTYYGRRRTVYERAHGQLLVASAVLLGVTSTVSALAGTEVPGKLIWAILAVIFPVLATALAAYGGLYLFERQAKLYGDAVRSLRSLEEPDLRRAGGQEAVDALARYVEQVEAVFRNEQSQWGQLAGEMQGSVDDGS
jgi:hypothetical protein